MTRLTVTALTLLIFTCAVQAQDSVNEIRSSLQAKQFTNAVKQIDDALVAADDERDVLLYLKGLALFYAEDFTNAIQTCNRLLTAHPNSAWFRKATFLKAQCYLKQKAYEQAEAIYSVETERLLSADRKSEMAQVYIELAEAIAKTPEKDELTAPPPNYQKAYNFYQKVLELEIDSQLQAEMMYRLGRMMQLAANYSQAIRSYQAYLTKFDPDFHLYTGTTSLPSSLRYEARYHLAECQIAVRQHLLARLTLEDLLKLIEAQDTENQRLIKDAKFLLPRTYGFPSPRPNELAQGVQSAERFLAEFPSDPRAMELVYEIGQAYQVLNRSEEAFNAYQNFLDQKNFTITDETDRLYPDLFPDATQSLVERHRELQMNAVFQMGTIRFSQQRYNEAIDALNRYIRDFPNGPNWTDAQHRIIDAEFQNGMTLVVEEKYDEAVQMLDTFQAKHPLDGRVRQISLIYGQIHFHNAEMLKKEQSVETSRDTEYRSAIAEWKKLVSKYPNTEESSLALFRIAGIYEEKLGQLDEALVSYRKLTWGSFSGQAQERIRQMTKKQLKLVTQRTFRTNESAQVHLWVRNIDALTVNLYKLNLESYWRKIYDINGVENLDLGLIAPDKTWEYSVPEYQKYKPFEVDVDIPIDGAGVYAVEIGDEDLEATTLVIRSDIEAITKTSRKEVLVFAQDVLKGEAVPGAKVLVSNGSQMLFEGRTGEDGVFRQKHDELKNAKRVTAFVVKDEHIAADRSDLSRMGISQGLTPRGYIYTDRPAYRPGNTVSIRGVIRDVTDGSYAVTEGEKYAISIIDSQGRLIHSEEIALSAFGTFNVEVQLDEVAPVGEYRIVAQRLALNGKRTSEQMRYTGKFLVERFQLEKVQLTIDFPRETYARGEKVEVTFTAKYYYGQPMKGAKIRYILPTGRTYTETADDEGKVRVVFDTTPMPPGNMLFFRGTIEGENVTVEDHVTLIGGREGRREFSIQVNSPDEVVLSGAPFDVEVETKNVNDKPVGKALTVKVIKFPPGRSQKPRHPVLSAIPGLEHVVLPAPGEVLVQEHQVQTDPDTGIGTIQLTLTEGGEYTIRVSGTDRFGTEVSGADGVFVSDDSDETKIRIFAERSKTEVGALENVRIHSRLQPGLALITFEAEGIIDYKITVLKPNFNPFQFTVKHEHFPNFSLTVTRIDGQKLRTTRKDFTVERQLNLRVSWKTSAISSQENGQENYDVEPFPTYVPGESAEAQIRATDQLGNPVKAEFSLALVDEALFSQYPDRVTPIKKFFQEGLRRKGAMQTASSCTFRYAPPTRQVIQEILKELQRLSEKKETELRRTQERFLALNLSELEEGDGLMREDEVLTAEHFYFGSAAGKASAGRAKVRKPVTKLALTEELRVPRDANQRGLVSLQSRNQITVLKNPRYEFPDAGHWMGTVVTNDAGIATVTIPMPEKTAKWRLTGRGCTVDTLVGGIRVNTVTRKDFFIDVKIPSIVTEGDKLRVHARLHNLTDFEGEAEVKLKIDVDGVETIFPKTVSIQKQDTTDFIFDPIAISVGKQLTIEVSAIAGTMTDAVKREIPIRPWGIEYADTKSGTASGNTTIYLELPSDRSYTRKELTLDIGQSVSRLIYDLAMRRYRPYRVHRPVIVPMPGDAGSDLLAVAYALGYVKKAGGYDTDNRNLLRVARIHVNRLITTQNKDGGWSWIGTSETDPRVTSRNVWAMTAARAQGVEIDDKAVTKATTYLKNAFAQIDQANDETKAIILHALSNRKEADFAYANRLYRRRNQMTPTALAYTALIFVNIERLEVAGEILDVLISSNLSPGPSPKRRGESARSVETTALALLAMESARPNSPWIKETVEYLIGQRRYNGYSPYKAKGPVVAALATYYQRTQFTSDDYQLTVSVNDKEIETIKVRGDAPNREIDIPADVLKDGRNKVEMTINGRGQYTYLATLNGFSSQLTSWVGVEPNPNEKWENTRVRRHYYHALLEYDGRPISAKSTSKITQLIAGTRTYVSVNVTPGRYGILRRKGNVRGYLVVDEYLPAGTTLVSGTIHGDFQHHEIGDSFIRFYYAPRYQIHNYGYQLISYAPGEYRVLPTVIRDAMHPGDMRIGTVASLTVLAPGEKSTDEYKMNNGERYALGKAYFDDGKYNEALPLLEELHKLKPDYREKDTAQMLLWMYTIPDNYDARKVVATFELLRERYLELYIPFDKIRVVGTAYRDIEEFERATLVHQSTIASSFANDSSVSAVLQDEGQFLHSIDFMENLWQQYPDTASVISSYFALSQALYANKDKGLKDARFRDTKNTSKSVTKWDMLKRTVELLSQFLTLYPTHPLADDAAFSLTNATLDLEDFQAVVRLCQLNQERYPNSDFITNFQYVEALGLFSLQAYDKAIQAATLVATSDSDDRDFARYILGQIYHAQGTPHQAIEWYDKVKESYPDAKESIAYFEDKRIALPEVTIKRPEEEASFTLKYRNIKEVAIQVYRVDLMKLYLREKDLSRVTQVRLAGIEPKVSKNLTLGDGKDYIEKSREISFSLTEEGAYLVICRGDNLFTSGLILITPLEIEVQEDAVSGRVRVNVRNVVTGSYQPKVHVKAIASADSRFIPGETDLRGVFIADGMHGKVTIIARDNVNRYAFYRGSQWLGEPETEAKKQKKDKQLMPAPTQVPNYRMYLDKRNEAIQSSNIDALDRMRRGVRKGVQVQSVY